MSERPEEVKLSREEGEELIERLSFTSSGRWLMDDSMGVLEMITAMEENLGITIDFEQMDSEAFTILGSFCRYVAENAVVYEA